MNSALFKHVSGTVRTILISLPFALVPFGSFAETNEPEQLAKRAFFAIEADPFDSDAVRAAAQDIASAYRSAPTNPWVLIAASRLVLEKGYIKGDRSLLSSYEADSIKAARDYARRAVERGPRESMAHVMAARLQILTEDYKGAWETLYTAHALDANGFYPWYYRAVLSIRMNDAKRADAALDEAEARVAMPFQRSSVVYRRITVARMKNDVAAEERGYKRLIEMEPSNAYNYGNYAVFLKRMKRYEEAITNYEKAIEIRPYPLVVEQLKQTKLLRDAAKR